MGLEREFQRLKAYEVFERLYENMTENQMLKMQERYATAANNLQNRFLAISRSVFEEHVKMIEEAKAELDSMAKVLTTTATLATLTQLCNDAGTTNWESFAELMNKTATDRSREAGAHAARAADDA